MKCRQADGLVVLIRQKKEKQTTLNKRKKSLLRHCAFKGQMAFVSRGCRIFSCNIKAETMSPGDEGNRDREEAWQGNGWEALEGTDMPHRPFSATNLPWLQLASPAGFWLRARLQDSLLALSFASFSPLGQQQEKPHLETFVVTEDIYYVFSASLPGLTFWPPFSLPLNGTILLTIAV